MLKTVEGISAIDKGSIKPGRVEINNALEEWRLVGIGKGREGDYLLMLERNIGLGAEQEGVRALLGEHPDFEGELLVDVAAVLGKDERGGLNAKLIDNQKGIWRVLRSDYWAEVYSIRGQVYDVTIRTLAYETARLAPIRQAFPELYGVGN